MELFSIMHMHIAIYIYEAWRPVWGLMHYNSIMCNALALAFFNCFSITRASGRGIGAVKPQDKRMANVLKCYERGRKKASQPWLKYARSELKKKITLR